jgi:hypothetical protein
MKVVDKDGNEVVKGSLKLVEPDGTEKEFDPVKWVKQARSTASEAADYRKRLNVVETSLKAYELEDGKLIDPELAAAAIKRAEKYKGDKESIEAQLQAAKDAYDRKLADAVAPLNDTIASLKQEKIKAALLSSKDLQGTIFFALGERHLMTEFGSLVDGDGNPLDRSGKPIMSDADPSKPATVAEAAPLWIATHPDGKEKIMLDTFTGGAGGSGGRESANDPGMSGYAGIVSSAKK